MGRPINLPEKRLRDAFHQHGRVVSALMLRDIKTRFGATYLGFMISMLIPLAHIGIVLVAYIILGRRAPIGTDVTIYLATAVVPFVIWSYTHKHIMQCFSQNRALTSFPIVKFIDILVARAAVELLNSSIIVFIISSVLVIYGHDLFVLSPFDIVLTLLMAYFLGVSTGFILGIVGLIVPGVMIVGFLIIPLYWLTSGIFFIPEALPENVRDGISLLPLSHIVDFGRVAFYTSYRSDYYSLSYVFVVIFSLILFSLVFERYLRPELTSK